MPPKKTVSLNKETSVNKKKQLSILDFSTCETTQKQGDMHIETTMSDKTNIGNSFIEKTKLEFHNLTDIDNVVNLSDYQLSDSEKSVLNHGLKFCPTPGEPHMGDIRRDLDRFHRSLRLKCHFGKLVEPAQVEGLPSTGPFSCTSDLKLKSNSTWQPPVGPLNLETIATMNELGLLETEIKNPRRSNITHLEKEALTSLTNNDMIIIKPADKGGAIVVMNRKDYIAEGLRQLGDEKFYQKLEEDPTMDNHSKVIDQLEAMRVRGEITQKVKTYLSVNKPRTAQLYLLPKIHKNVRPVPGRPIVSANDSATERISAFVDHFLAPIVRQSRSYLRDTSDFLNKLTAVQDTKPGDILVTLDVSSLYTNIPNLEGLNAAYDALCKDRGVDAQPSNISLMEMLNQVLTMNSFQFNGTNYLQIGGTAMGTRVAPSYANIFMSYFEDKYVYNYHLQPLVWYRYIDDVFCIWQHGETELNEFVKHLNTVHGTIKFTTESSLTEISFLDTMVQLNDGDISTDLYCKPTDRNNYLPYDSAHPPHCKKGLPYGQFLRLRRICSRYEDFLSNSAKKAAFLLQKKYPIDELTEAFLRAEAKERSQLLRPKETPKKEDKEKDPIYLTTTYNPVYNGLSKQVRKTWDLLDRASSTRDLHDRSVRIGYRRPKNLKDILVKTKLTTDATCSDQPRTKPDLTCKARNCRYCPKLEKGGKITSKTTGRKYYAKTNVTCNSNNVVYCISCKRCGKQYVGQTKNSLKQRFQSHFYYIAHDAEKTEVSRHFNREGHKGLDDVSIHVLEFIHHGPQSEGAVDTRLSKEFDWIHRIRSQIPLGMNAIDSAY